MLSISLTADRPAGLVAAVVAGEHGVGALLTDDQKRLIDKYGATMVNFAALTMLPAVSAMRWPTFAVPRPGGPALDARAERWTVHELDFLELSIAAKLKAAQADQAALIAFVERKGLRQTTGEAKATQVMQRLVAEAAC
jgi:hypothetical protein